MKTNTFITKQLRASLATLGVAAWATCSSLAADADFSRQGKIEAYGTGLYLSGDHFSGYGGGLGVGYHFTDYISLNGELTGGRLESGPIDGALYVGTMNMEYNLLKKRFTPFLTVGVGALGYDVKQGFIRGAGVNALVSGGAGLRWDVTDRFFIKAEYRALGVFDQSNAELVHSATVGLGFTF